MQHSLVNGFISIALMAIAALVTRRPFIFPSLGPTAFLFFYTPTVFGHLIGALAGWLSLAAFGLTAAPTRPPRSMFSRASWRPPPAAKLWGRSARDGRPFLLLDEPTTGVDPAARRSFWRAVSFLADLVTAILATVRGRDRTSPSRRWR